MVKTLCPHTHESARVKISFFPFFIQFPPRLKVQCLKPHQWARVPNQSLQVHALKLSDIRGWSMLCEDAVSMLALHIPEEDRCIDILELIEMERLLR